jgi:hypothetical protein
MRFTNLATFVGAGRIEVAQTSVFPPVRGVIRFQRLLKKELGNSVGIYRGLADSPR